MQILSRLFFLVVSSSVSIPVAQAGKVFESTFSCDSVMAGIEEQALKDRLLIKQIVNAIATDSQANIQNNRALPQNTARVLSEAPPEEILSQVQRIRLEDKKENQGRLGWFLSFLNHPEVLDHLPLRNEILVEAFRLHESTSKQDHERLTRLLDLKVPKERGSERATVKPAKTESPARMNLEKYFPDLNLNQSVLLIARKLSIEEYQKSFFRPLWIRLVEEAMISQPESRDEVMNSLNAVFFFGQSTKLIEDELFRRELFSKIAPDKASFQLRKDIILRLVVLAQNYTPYLDIRDNLKGLFSPPELQEIDKTVAGWFQSPDPSKVAPAKSLIRDWTALVPR